MTLAHWLVVVLAALILSAPAASSAPVFRIDRVTDGDTVVLRNGQRVRLVQIDTPKVFFGIECYGPQASALTKKLLPSGTKVRLLLEPATDRVDDYGRLLRYVIRVKDSVNVNLRLVAKARRLRTSTKAVAGCTRPALRPSLSGQCDSDSA